MNYSLESLRSATAAAIAGKLAGKSERYRKLYRRKTASWLDDCFFAIVRRLNVRHFVECGAHDASASVRFIRGGGGKALAIEANPLTFARKTILASETEGVEVVNCGVGPEAGEAEFFIPRSDDTDGSASFLRKEGVEYKSERIPVQTLDTLHASHFTILEPTALWVDVEGLGLEVVRSGLKLLSHPNCWAIKIEVETRQFWSGQSLVSQLNDFLTGHGFVPVLRDIEYAGQYNIIFVRDVHASSLDEELVQSWFRLGEVRLDWSEKLNVLTKDYRLRFKS
jgi:FkbM family methyltransferase